MPEKNTAEATEADPKAVFETLTFAEAGTYEYTLTEIDDGVEGVTYDTASHKVVVTVTKEEGNVLAAVVTYDGADSLTVTNTYEEPTPPPDTRDSSRPFLWLSLIMASLLGMIAMVLMLRRPRRA
jgi:pilin isopeptide linkage protein